MTLPSRRIGHFVVLAGLLATANTFGSTVAASLFLSRVGVEGIPLYYILFALLSIPVTVGFARVIDRWHRRRLFAGMLLAGTALSALLALLGELGGRPGYYVLYLVISVFEQLSYSLLYVLLADYLTSLEVTRGTTVIAIASSLGGLIGGGFVTVLALGGDASSLLFGMPLLLAVTLGDLALVSRAVRPLPETGSKAEAESGLMESLGAVPRLVRRYPIISLIAGGVFLNIVVQSVLEYQVFLIYTAEFPDQRDLTAFLGLMTACLNAVGMGSSLFVTGPLLRRLGVGRMNLVYPGIMVAAFAALAASFRLPTAILGHIVYDALARGIDAPVFLANYNAVPHRLVGRVRMVNDGVVYPLAMTAAGGALVVLQAISPPLVITACGALLALAFWGCGLAIRRGYERSLFDSLRTGSIELVAPDGRLAVLPRRHRQEVPALLASGDPRMEMLGLELAVRADAFACLPDIERLLARAGPDVRGAFALRLARASGPGTLGALHHLLGSTEPAVRAAALQALLAAAQPVPEADLPVLLGDADPEVAALAWVAAVRQGAAAADAPPNRDPPFRDAVVRAVGGTRERSLLPLLARWWPETAGSRRAELLTAAAALVGPADGTAIGWTSAATDDPDPSVRAAALRLLAAVATPDRVERLARGLADPVREVRQAACAALRSLGTAAIDAVTPWLDDHRPEVEWAAIESLGGADPLVAEPLLYRHLRQRHFPAVARSQHWRRQLQAAPAEFDLLRAAIDDSDRRSVQSLLHVLAALGLRRSIDSVRRVMLAGDERTRANAIEAIASLRHRRFVLPLLPVLEAMVAPPEALARDHAGDRRGLLAEAAAAPDHWIRLGARLAGHAPDGTNDLTLQHRDPSMSRLLFLRGIPLFEGLLLDELLAVDEALVLEDHLDGETIVREGNPGDRLYLIYQGEVALHVHGRAAEREVARLGPGQYFGEMALFDMEPRSASAVAVGDAAMLTLARDRFTSLALQRPEILFQICKVFSRRLREANARLEG